MSEVGFGNCAMSRSAVALTFRVGARGAGKSARRAALLDAEFMALKTLDHADFSGSK